MRLSENGRNSFTVWDAGQSIMAQEVKHLLANSEQTPSEAIERMSQAVIDAGYDDEFKALMLTLPSFDELAAQINLVDPQALSAAIDKLKLFIATQFEQALVSLYQACQLGNNSNKAARTLANTCLGYLSLLAQHTPLVQAQFNNATNMTEQLGALQSAVKNIDIQTLDELLASFEQRWLDDTLVMDKWFSLQANVSNDDIFDRLARLMAREDFSLQNPNRARSLIGAFAMQNAKAFHQVNGQGYDFLAEQVIAMDKVNPQVASRLITPLIQYEGFAEGHQQLMVAALKRIAQQPSLSRDITEKLDAALKG